MTPKPRKELIDLIDLLTKATVVANKCSLVHAVRLIKVAKLEVEITAYGISDSELKSFASALEFWKNETSSIDG